MRRRTLTRKATASSVALALLLAAAQAHAQAEPAPEGYEPPPGVPISIDPRRVACEREARQHRWLLWVNPRFVVSMGNGSDGLQRLGFGAGLGISGAFAVFGRARLSLGVSFAYERRQETRVPPPSLANGDTVAYASQASFSADLKLDGFFLEGVLRPWVSIGPAMSVATYSSPPIVEDPMPVSDTSILGGVRAAVGIAGVVGARVEIGGRGEWLATFGEDPLGMRRIHPRSPGNFALAVDVGFRF
jgi:hypothetical protein